MNNKMYKKRGGDTIHRQQSSFTVDCKFLWIELFNKAAKSGCNLKSINSSKKNIILIFILLSLLFLLIKTYCAAKTMIKHKIDDLSLLKVHTYNVLYEKLLFAFAYRNRSTIYQVFKDFSVR